MCIFINLICLVLYSNIHITHDNVSLDIIQLLIRSRLPLTTSALLSFRGVECEGRARQEEAEVGPQCPWDLGIS